jgi:hypothetical protein
MYNRSGDGQSMSEFMKGKILEEDDDGNNGSHDESHEAANKSQDLKSQIESLHVTSKSSKMEEDFDVFQMDKGFGSFCCFIDASI